jgi:hypothetical protein
VKYKTNWLSGLLCPMLVAFNAHAVQTNMAQSQFGTVFIDNGSVFAMGSNNYGEVLPGSNGQFTTPLFTGVQTAKTVAASVWRLAYLKEDGTARLNGLSYTTFGAVSNPFPDTGITDIALSVQTVFYIKAGQVYAWTGDTASAPVALAGGAGAASIAAGDTHLVVLFSDGSVGTYGTNAYGQLGNGGTTPNTAIVKVTLPSATPVVEVAAGAFTTFIRLMNTEAVYAIGRNNQYQLGLQDNIDRYSPTVVLGLSNVVKMSPTTNHTSMLMGDGYIATAGWHNYIGGSFYNTSIGFYRMPYGTADDISSGTGDQTVVRVNALPGQISGLGGNTFGKLGDGTQTERHTMSIAFFTPVAAPTPPAPPVVVPAVAPAASAPAPAASAPVPDMAIALPFNAVPAPSIVTPPVTVTQVVVNAVIDAVVAVVNTVQAVVNAVVAAVTPTPPPVVVPPVVVTPPVVVAAPPAVVQVPPVAAAKPVIVTVAKSHNERDDDHGDRDHEKEVKKVEIKKVEVKSAKKDDDRKEGKKG